MLHADDYGQEDVDAAQDVQHFIVPVGHNRYGGAVIVRIALPGSGARVSTGRRATAGTVSTTARCSRLAPVQRVPGGQHQDVNGKRQQEDEVVHVVVVGQQELSGCSVLTYAWPSHA